MKPITHSILLESNNFFCIVYLLRVNVSTVQFEGKCSDPTKKFSPNGSSGKGIHRRSRRTGIRRRIRDSCHNRCKPNNRAIGGVSCPRSSRQPWVRRLALTCPPPREGRNRPTASTGRRLSLE